MSQTAASSSRTRMLPLFFVTCLVLVSSCSTAHSPGQNTGASAQPDDAVVAAANSVLAALEHKDSRRLASLVHPSKGVRFSPSAYVDVETDRVFMRSQIEGFWTDASDYVWGYADGSGEPITMTPSAYSNAYILTRDFSHAELINVNDDQASGNTVNNAAKTYPMATRVEYYVPASKSSPEAHFDWAALRLVFERVDGEWRLVGVIHDQWSV